MKIVIYTYFKPLFGRFCHSWAKSLRIRGYEVETYETTNLGDQPLPNFESADVHLIVEGVFILKALRNYGFPKHGNTILWICEPLVNNPSSSHYWKFDILRDIGSRFHAIAGMNQAIVESIHEYFPSEIKG